MRVNTEEPSGGHPPSPRVLLGRVSIAIYFLFAILPEAGLAKCRKSTSSAVVQDPVTIESLKFVSATFLKRNPACRNLPVCIDADRLSLLERRNIIPSGYLVSDYLSGSAKTMAERACEDSEFARNRKDLTKFLSYATGNYDSYPQEAASLYKAAAQAKQKVGTYLAFSREAVIALGKCLELNQLYSKITHSDVEKLNLYRQEIAANQRVGNLPSNCERIWKPDSELTQIRKSLFQMRQIVALYRLYVESLKPQNRVVPATDSVRGVTDQEARFFALVADLDNGLPVPFWFSKSLQVNLSPLNAGKLEILYPDSIWTSAPKQIEPLNTFEKHKLLTTLTSVASSKASGNLEASLAAEYFRLLSENPILIFFDSARPNSQDFVRAFKKNEKLFEVHTDTQLGDLDYLAFPSVLATVLKETPQDKRGDLCVLVDSALKNNDEFKNMPEEFLTAAVALEGGIAGRIAYKASAAAAGLRGGIKPIAASIGRALGGSSKDAAQVGQVALSTIAGSIFGARISGTLLGLVTMEKSFEIQSAQLAVCANVSTRSKGLCDFAKMETARNELAIGIAMTVVFGGRRALAGSAATISGSVASPNQPGADR